MKPDGTQPDAQPGVSSGVRRLFPYPSRAFTLVELLVVIAIIAVLIGILMPATAMVRRRAQQAGCESNLHNIGLAIATYAHAYKDVCPVARSIPEPFLTTDTDPPLPQPLSGFMAPGWPNGGAEQQVYHCPGDRGYVYDLSKMSYQYETLLSGLNIDKFFPVKFFNATLSEVWVVRDFDGATFDLSTGGSVDVPFFHTRRRFLFGDGHVGDFKD